MTVEPYDNPLRFLVASESDNDIKYLVDIGENDAFGKCTCQHFDFRIQPAINSSTRTIRCKHITKAREFFLDNLIKRMVSA
jgi:hypothetical protein